MRGPVLPKAPIWSRIPLLLVGVVASFSLGCSGGAAGTPKPEDGIVLVEDGSAGDGQVASDGVSEDVPEGSRGDDAGEAWVYSPCALQTRVGGFQITLAEEYTGINGQVMGGVVPSHVPELISESGGCRLLRARVLHCDPGCVPGETCGEDGACIPHPEALSVGAVTITGMKEPHVIEAKWGNHYTNSGTLDHPGYDFGAEIQIEAAGGDADAFTLRGHGVEPLVLSGSDAVVEVVEGEPLELSWTPMAAHDGVRVHVDLNINNHGSGGAYILCDVEDSGSHVIPAELMTALQDFGVSGFPSLVLTRRSADAVALSIGCVEFLVNSEKAVAVEIDGVTSCTSDKQCPPGQACGVDLQCS